ncbi:hypothetical protein IWX49DRAFT_213632 [Phyllosticta citricarpa]|uniref:Uncharacterized protein n=1 Tax=Phyllosticta paracitricarpa TaxID=2016321 RepID=A0ABR1NGS4_9PEZI
MRWAGASVCPMRWTDGGCRWCVCVVADAAVCRCMCDVCFEWLCLQIDGKIDFSREDDCLLSGFDLFFFFRVWYLSCSVTFYSYFGNLSLFSRDFSHRWNTLFNLNTLICPHARVGAAGVRRPTSKEQKLDEKSESSSRRASQAGSFGGLIITL